MAESLGIFKILDPLHFRTRETKWLGLESKINWQIIGLNSLAGSTGA
jgi:hypothetical protein